MSPPAVTLITGGAGFIGTNLADRLMREGRDVLVFDDLSRPGVRENLDWLLARHPERLTLHIGDVRDERAVAAAVACASEIYHFAAQVAVTSSLEAPARDFEVNARGTLNVLEAMRQRDAPPALLYTSTNKVYGALEDISLVANGRRYEPAEASVRDRGIDEHRPLDFHSPYGCSKGAAEQYVLDYARSFGLRTIVFRMSCIYGPHQHGNEDQGWVAHFLMRARDGGTLSIFGDGLQVRDVLFVDDLVAALVLAMANSASLSGRAFNIGGGPHNTLSLLELIALLSERSPTPFHVRYFHPRRGDQRYYVSDTRAFRAATGWQPQIPLVEGIARLRDWLEIGARGRAATPPSLAVAR